MVTLKFPINNEKISLQTDAQELFFKDENQRADFDGNLTFKWNDLQKQGEDFSIPSPVTFRWEDECEQSNQSDACYYLLVSENEDISAPWVYITDKCYYDVYNLKVDTKYFWCVQKSGKRSDVFSFQTLPTLPRCIKIDNISNVRDIGGYKVAGGKIRQGLVYRGGEFELHMHLNRDGAEELLRLGIRSELDMRGEANGQIDFTTAELIGINRIYVPSVPYTNVFNKDYSRAVKSFFRMFTDPKNYPIYFHCWGGADRTGTFAFILGAFLGMCFEDLINEYEFTSLAIWGMRSRNYEEFDKFVKLFMTIPGKTLQEKGYSFLKTHAGLTEKQICTIYDILIEKDIR